MHDDWTLLVVESPYAAGDVERNVEFCRNVCRYAVTRGYAPYASHLFFTQFLDDGIPEERHAGIHGGLAWSKHAAEAWFALRPGENLRDSRGMALALERHLAHRRVVTVKRFQQDGTFLHDECYECGRAGPRHCYICNGGGAA